MLLVDGVHDPVDDLIKEESLNLVNPSLVIAWGKIYLIIVSWRHAWLASLNWNL